jgi:hypothetical protein
MQHCEECGAELPTNALFCVHCGRKTTGEHEIATHVNSSPLENVSGSQSAVSMPSNDSEDSTLANREEEKQQKTELPSVNDAEDVEHPSSLKLEPENEEQIPDLASEELQEPHSPDLTSESENEEQIPQHHSEPISSMPGSTDSEPEILANQLPDDQSQDTQSAIAPQEMQSSYASAQKRKSQPVPRCLLFSLAGLIVIVGVVVALIGLFHLSIPGFGRSSNAQSSSIDNEITNPTGSSLTASICVNTSTPSSSVTNSGSTFTLSSASGCSTVTASKANSSCLIFPNATGASHKYIVDVSNAAIDSTAYHLVFGIVDYAGPTTYNDAKHISVGFSEGSTGRTFSWLYRSGNVSINNDEQSGTMDVILKAVNGGNTLHIMGDWACGRQTKST